MSDEAVVYCQWFALCPNQAHGVVAHPVLDWVPTCQRCADKLGLDLIEAVFEYERG